MNKRRLLKLADLLEADAKNKKGIKFDLSGWGHTPRGPATVSCGTTACAMGLAVISGAFKKAGLSNLYGQNSSSICPLFRSKNRAYQAFDAASRLFDLKKIEASWLFSKGAYRADFTEGARGERAVAKRIRDFVAGKVHP